MIQRAADESGVPWQVIAAIMIVESGGDPDAQSAAGAVGLMQIRPDHWQQTADTFGGNLRDPWTNIRTGAAILADAYQTWGTWEQAAAAYAGTLDDAGNITDRFTDDGLPGSEYVALFQRQLVSLGYPVSPAASSGLSVIPSAEVVKMAMRALGTPYVWGGESYAEGGFDCSGLVLWAYAQIGRALPRTAAEQWEATSRLDPIDVRPGDLVFFFNTYTVGDGERQRIANTDRRVITHVAIYVGNGMMLHAPKLNDYVRLTPLDTPYWRAHLAGYGRVG